MCLLCFSPWGRRVGHSIVTEQQQQQQTVLIFISPVNSNKLHNNIVKLV